ncbi:MAG: ABC transporter substrate-binding protein [Candidatus Lokiarchaeota archaeon]|nr:ABC transporter substrate-binding protein [Candidatus Lokiarchaeota archaeon]
MTSPKRKVGRRSKTNFVIIFFAGFLIGSLLTGIVITSGEEATHITIIYSSEKASWMTIAYTNFLNYWRSNPDNFEIKIDMHPYGSSDSIIAILNGEIFPTIWSPASSIWMTFLNTKWRDLTGEEISIVNVEEAVKIIYSPIVIATWESFNRTHNINGLADVRALNLNPSVDVKMAHTDPRLSNSGYMTTIMAVAAASGKPTQNLTMSDLTNPDNQQWLRDFESSAITYGKSTGFLARYMKNQGPTDLNIAFLYENLIRDISSTSVGGKVIAVYPEEGTLYSDHPFCILNANWITPKQREVANEFLIFLNKRETVISAMEYGFRPINSSIPLDPEVFNYETNGISFNLSIPELKTPTDGDVLLKIPDLWLLCKSTA